jgi:hypothetical protein
MTLIGSTKTPANGFAVGQSPGVFLKDWNYFYHPMAGENYYTPSSEFEIQLQIGGRKFPEYPLRSFSETFSALRKCMGIQSSNFHSFDINTTEYRTWKFIVGIDTEKVLQASFSGENIKNGSLLTIMMKSVGSNPNNYPTGAYVVMHYDAVLNIKDTGCELLD